MPEGPEVKRLVVQLQDILLEEELLEVTILTGRYTKKPPEGISSFSSSLPKVVKDVSCKGKFIYIEFDSDDVIFTTLGMTGTWKTEANKYARIKFRFELFDLYYCDMRNFGTIKFTNQKELLKKLSSIGPDMLSNPCTLEEFHNLCNKHKGRSLVSFLMEQTIISGVGNIYKSESMYLAGVHPSRKIGDLSFVERSKLYYSIIKVLNNSYRLGGATISNYTDMFNNEGQYTRFASNPKEIVAARNNTKFNHAQEEIEEMSGIMVYNQKVDPFGNPVIKIKLNDGRTTHYVPAIQQ